MLHRGVGLSPNLIGSRSYSDGSLTSKNAIAAVGILFCSNSRQLPIIGEIPQSYYSLGGRGERFFYNKRPQSRRHA
jgi:hypothetical protein